MRSERTDLAISSGRKDPPGENENEGYTEKTGKKSREFEGAEWTDTCRLHLQGVTGLHIAALNILSTAFRIPGRKTAKRDGTCIVVKWRRGWRDRGAKGGQVSREGKREPKGGGASLKGAISRRWFEYHRPSSRVLLKGDTTRRLGCI